jgi:hypothetical protein
LPPVPVPSAAVPATTLLKAAPPLPLSISLPILLPLPIVAIEGAVDVVVLVVGVLKTGLAKRIHTTLSTAAIFIPFVCKGKPLSNKAAVCCAARPVTPILV